MGLFNKSRISAPQSPQSAFLRKYNGARNNLLLVVAFSLINMISVITGSSTYFLFSASVPYYLTFFGMYYTGKLPADYYYGLTDFEPFATGFLVTMAVISVIIVAVYGLCWFMSKKHGYGWLIFALVIFVIDTIFMFVISGVSVDIFMDIIFHIWIIVSLCGGVIIAVKNKKNPINESDKDFSQNGIPVMANNPFTTENQFTENSSAEPVVYSQPEYNELPKESVNDIPKED